MASVVSVTLSQLRVNTLIIPVRPRSLALVRRELDQLMVKKGTAGAQRTPGNTEGSMAYALSDSSRSHSPEDSSISCLQIDRL